MLKVFRFHHRRVYIFNYKNAKWKIVRVEQHAILQLFFDECEQSTEYKKYRMAIKYSTYISIS